MLCVVSIPVHSFPMVRKPGYRLAEFRTMIACVRMVLLVEGVVG